MTVKNIAFSGFIGSGKTSLANMLVDRLSYVKLSFASLLKKEYCLINNVPTMDLYIEGVKEVHRKGLQDLGSLRREEDKNYWVKGLVSEVDNLTHCNFVVDDMRYVNEFMALARKDFILVRLDCPYVDSLNYILSKGKTIEEAKSALSHASETDLQNVDKFFDIVIDAPRNRDLSEIYDEIISRVVFS